MILLDIVNNISEDLLGVDSDCNSTDKNYVTLKFKNNYNNDIQSDNSDNENIINKIIGKPLKIGDSVEIKCKICCFLGSGSYGNVYKIKIKKKYYALKISENEEPDKFLKRYESIINVDKMKKYVIDIYIAGNIKCDKFPYYSIMEYGGSSLKSKIPFDSYENLMNILKQLHNIVYLCGKYKIILTDFKLNNVVVGDDGRLKLIDLYMDCKSYNPCKECRIVKTYSTIEIDRVRGILDDDNYTHSYHFIPLGVGLIDLLCKKTASTIMTSLGSKYGIYLNIKQMLPLVQVACYNYTHKSNSALKEYDQVYLHKKKLEKKYPVIKKPEFYESLMKLIEVRDIYKEKMPTKTLHKIIHNLFSAHCDDRSLDALKQQLNE